ncbi:MAG: hypothetical protein BWY81_00903 [Firmicutes bacterium ADurb.Bin467]|nr:MAG: hypothetical protein BWY81_00903 [Firmicutes bacterium ADurb.Bin467]
MSIATAAYKSGSKPARVAAETGKMRASGSAAFSRARFSSEPGRSVLFAAISIGRFLRSPYASSSFMIAK